MERDRDRIRRRCLVTVAAAAILAGAMLVAPAGASAKTVWLCKPGKSPNPCRESLRTTVITSEGASRVANVKLARRPKIDCFYVYPTVSDQPTVNADLTIDPQQTAVARYQASRFSQRCRVFAPVYRQLTLSGINASPTQEQLFLAYGDVRRAWEEYWRRHNDGRGVVLIGHSQGTGMLTQLVREKVDRFRSVRRRLVSALLLGGNVTVKEDSDRGGVFKNVPACRKARQRGCVVAYSVFNDVPPDDARFGTPAGALVDAFGLGDRTDLEVLCNNPAALGGGGAPLRSLMPTSEFPGTIGIGLRATFSGEPPTAATPWVQPQDHYTGECVESSGANVLMISPVAGARTLLPVPDATWGIHLGDVNLALGDLVRLVGRQAAAFQRARAKRRRSK